MPWFLFALLLGISVIKASEVTAHENKKLPSVVIVGTVYCDTCFRQTFSRNSHFLSGATVAVQCNDGPSGQIFREEVKTNKHGEFKVNLPVSIGKHLRKIKSCSVELISSNQPYCSVASSASSSSLHQKSSKQGTHVFSAGFFTFKPLNQPNLCNEKPSDQQVKSNKAIDPILPFPPPTTSTPSNGFFLPLPFLPNLPNLPPLPQLPPLPSLPSLPKIPPKLEKSTGAVDSNSKSSSSSMDEQKTTYPEFFFPPNPFRPPSLFPPNPLQPPPAPLIPLPPIPGLTLPPPPAFPFPFPPFPFPPSTPFPGIPPASSSSSSSP